VDTWFQQFGQAQTLANGAVAQPRTSFDKWRLTIAKNGTNLTAQDLANNFHTTSLANRLDLASIGNCGEARITFALDSAYVNGDQRMTIIVELKVPDDGAQCRTVAQQWAELSYIDDLPTRKAQLISLYQALLAPAHLGQVRTNEFINLPGNLPWELREWHLNAQGMLSLAPVKQTVQPALGQNADFLTWVNNNLAPIADGTVVIPDTYLAANSAENGGRLQLQGDADPKVLAAENSLNALACAGCHLTETQSPFVHVGERLGQLQGSSFVPWGRSVIDGFVQAQLPIRARTMQSLLSDTALHYEWRPVTQVRVH
jgi:hypothetical protein